MDLLHKLKLKFKKPKEVLRLEVLYDKCVGCGKCVNNGNYATYKKYKSVIKKLRAYIKQDKLPINSITPDLISAYEHHLLNVVGNKRK